MVDRIGQHLGNYCLTHQLGQGGFADVYLGEHIHLGTRAAIKVLQMHMVGSNMEQFRHEAQTIASLMHPHIVRILDFGVEDGLPFLVMDYAPHGTLRQRHPRGTRLSAVSILPYVRQVAAALQYAHDRRLIHRDIKPENMLVGLDDNILLSDFGLVLLAQSTSAQTTKEMAGTLSYMAPEQINGKPRIASDQYSLGIVVYEWLSGHCPFRGSFVEVATQHLMTPPAPLSGRVPQVSPPLEEVVFTALAKDPRQRYPSMQAFATAFEQVAQTVPPDPLLVAQTISLSSASALSTDVNPPLGQAGPSPLGGPAPGPLSPAERIDTSTGPFSQFTSVQTPLNPPSQSTFVGQSSPSTLVHTPPSPSSQSTFAFTPPPTAVVPAPRETQLFKQDLSSSQEGEQRPDDSAEQTTSARKSDAPQGRTDRPTSQSAQAFPVPRPARRRWWLVALSTVLTALVIGGGLVVVGNPLFGRMNPTATPTTASNSTATTRSHLMVTTAPNATATSKAHPTSGAHPTGTTPSITPTPATPTPTRPGGLIWTATTRNNIYSSPAVVNGIVYVGFEDAKLYAFNATSGALVWTATTGGSIYSSPAVANGIVYVGFYDHKLYAFNASNGTLVWTATTGFYITSSPAVVNGIVYVGSWDDNLYAFNASNGTLVWTASTGGIIESSPMVANGIVYVGSDDHRLYAFKAG